MFRRKLFIWAIAILAFASVSAHAKTPDRVIWQIGQKDGTPGGFALAPDRFRAFLENDFGYEDKYYIVGYSSAEKDFPYVLPGPVDTWGGTWITSGWRTHCVTILFELGSSPRADKDYLLNIHLADYSGRFLPLVKVSVNESDTKIQLQKGGVDFSGQPRPTPTEPVVDTLSLCGKLTDATPYTMVVPLEGAALRKGSNQIVITVLEGSWILFDQIELLGPSRMKLVRPSKVFIRDISPAPYQLGKDVQPLLVDLEHLSASPEVEVRLDGRTIMKKTVENWLEE